MTSTATRRTSATSEAATRAKPARRPAARKRSARHHARRLSRLLAWLLSTVLGSAGLAYAQVPAHTLPTGGQVVVGSGQLQQTGNLLIVNQATSRLGMDWQSFSIGSNATVEFRQPGADSIALNRVVGHSGSGIYGQLRSNGQVFLTNPNGVLFAPGSKVDVGGLVASTLDLSQQDFDAGRFTFGSIGGRGSVVNQGTLRASAGGYLALFGQQVENAGTMSVNAGSVVLASGRAATVSISGSGLISAVVTPGESGSVVNSGQIQADGGIVTLTAQSAEGIAASLVNNTGIVRANALVERNGEIWITGDQVSTTGRVSADATGGTDAGRITVKGGMVDGSLVVGGQLSAQAEGGRGGQIETSAANVRIASDARVNTLGGAAVGNWTIDPTDFTVGAGTDPLTTTGIGATTLSDNLKTTSVTLATAATGSGFGDINVLAPVAWSSDTSLTLTAHRNININAELTATGANAALALNPGTGGKFNLGTGGRVTLSGASSGLTIGGQVYTLLRTIDAIQAINTSDATRSANYALAVDIDASATATWNAGAGFVPIGNNTTYSSNNSFRGRFDGLGHTISNLTINRPTATNVGLFGVVHDGAVVGAPTTARDTTIRNVQLTGASVVGRSNVGTLVGYAAGKSGTTTGAVQIENVLASGTLSISTGAGTAYGGGLIGQFSSTPGLISRASSSVDVTMTEANGNVGGLVGWLTAGSIAQSSASGNVTSTSTSVSRVVGGLVGYFDGAGTLSDSQASGNVSNASYAGGLVGYYGSTGGLSNVQASGNAAAFSRAGGLIGEWNNAGAISNASSSGTVSGGTYVGGLIGYAYNTTTPGGSLLGVRSSSAVSGPSYVGGLLGYSYHTSIDKLVGTGGAPDVLPGTTGTVAALATTANNNTVYAGGLVGQFQGTSATDRIANATSTSTVSSTAPYGYVGGLVGLQSNGSIADSSTSGSVTATNAINSRSLGGLVGYMDGVGTLTRVSASGAVSGGYDAGGLIGYQGSTGAMSFATATGNVTGQQYVGGLIGRTSSAGTITDSSASGNVITAFDGGGLVGYWYFSGNMSDSRATGRVSSTGTGGSQGGLIGYGYASAGTSINNSSAAGDVFGAQYVGGLAGNLNIINISRGTATGNVQSLSNSTTYVGGLVGYHYLPTAGGNISNSSASGTVRADAAGARAGGLVGQMDGGAGSISGSSATGRVTALDSTSVTSGSSHFAGGLVGYFQGTTISDSSASGAVSGRYYTGGLVGINGGNISSGGFTNVSASGNVEGTQYVGGLIGYSEYNSITNGVATGNVVGADNGYVGGLLGYGSAYSTVATSRISDSRASGTVTGGTSTGGLIGYWQDYYTTTASGPSIVRSSASGAVNGKGEAGGLVGNYNNGDSRSTARTGISDSFASGDVQGSTYVGGLVGRYNSFSGLVDSRASGAVRGSSTTGSQYLGGLVGYYLNYSSTAGTGQLLRSYATGSVALATGATAGTFSDIYAGGLVGYLDGPTTTTVSLADSYATGSVNLTAATGRFRVGGLLGFTDTSIARTYATGAVSATGSVSGRQLGGLVGQRSNTTVTATSSFWATDTSGLGTSVIGTASTLAALRDPATFTGWDLATTGGTSQVWRIYTGQTTPLLRAQLTPLSLTLADLTKVYDGQVSLGAGAISIGGITVSRPDEIRVSGISPNVGSYAIDGSNLYSTQTGYDLTITGSANLTVNPRALTLSGLVLDKVYDGTVAATLAGTPKFGGLVEGEDLVFNPGAGFAATFDSKNVGAAKLVTLSGGYAIADGVRGLASNYLAPTASTTTASITPRSITGAGFTATNRVYDGTTSVAVSATGATFDGVVAGDSVSVDLSGISSGTLADKNVGTGKAVTVSGVSITGTDAGNYILAGVDGVKVDITPKTLTVNGITAADRAYNRNTFVSLSDTSVSASGLVAGDIAQPRLTSFSGTVADKNVGDAKPVTVTGLALRGPDAANYTAVPGAVSVNITPYLLTVFLGTTSSTSRVYDGTANASVTFPVSWYSGDDLTVNATSVAYDNKNVAYTTGGAVTIKPITATGITLSGADAANYTLQNTTATTNGTITPKPLAVTGVSAVDRVYDGTRNVTVTIAGATVDTTAVIPGDVVSVSTPGSGSVVGTTSDKNAGSGKAVTVPGLTLTGTDAGNYSITSSSGGGVTVNIAKKDLTAVYTAQDKVYDGSTAASVTVTSSDIVAGDRVRFYADSTYCYGCYNFFTESGFTTGFSYVGSRHAGTAKPVVITFNGLYDTDAANYNLLNTRGTSVASITPKPVTLAFSGASKVYDGTTAATVALNTSGSGIYFADAVATTQTAVYTGTAAKNAGTGKPIAVSDIVLSGANAGNYSVSNTTATTTGAVTPKPVTISGITATDRAYDGTTTVAVTAGTVGSAGFVSGDVVSVSLPPGGLTSGTIVNKNVGTSKPVTVTGLGLTGADATNYSIDATGSGITVNITPAALTPTYSSVSRVYNGGTGATVVSTTTGILSGDVVTFSQDAFYSGAGARDVGTGKPITINNITLGGSGAANYSLASTTATTTGDITPKPVTVTYIGGSRVYNGLANVSASVVGSSLQFLAGDSVGLAQTAAFTGDGSAGINKPVAISGITLTGAQAANYSLLATTATATATITPRPLGVTGITATNRVYDGTTTVSVNVAGATVDTSSVIAGDSVSVVLPPAGISTGTLADRNVGNNKPVAITGLTISGSSAANYTLVGAAGLRVNITPKSLTALYTGVNKVYDGSADATVTATSSDLLSIDTGLLGISAAGVFTDGKNVGTGKSVSFTGAFLTGAARDNYTLTNATGTTTADITPRSLTASFTGGSKVYDGGVTAVVTGNLSGRITGDSVATSQVAVFTGAGARNVGTGKPIDVSSITLSGADAGNYTLATTSASTSGSITPKPITVSGLSSVRATDRTYDGTRIVEVTVPSGVTLIPDSSDIVAGDTVSISVPVSGVTSGTMANKYAGTGKAVNVDGLTLSGADAGNYSIAGTAGITVNIAPRNLTASFSGVNKVYDATTTVGVSGSSLDLLAGDSLVISGSGVITGAGAKNAGTGKEVDVLSASLSGTDARNYVLLNTTGTTTVDVTPRPVTATYVGGSRFYDGSTSAPVSASSGLFLFGDSVSLSQTAVFTGAGAKNAGTGKAITISGITLSGDDAINYSLTGSTASATGSILPKPIALTGLTGVVATNRVYDGTRTVEVNVSSTGTIAVDPADVVAGDVVGVSAPVAGLTTGTMVNKNVGIGKAVVVDGLTLTGADAANYTVAATSGLTVNITPRGLTAVYSGLSKVYDGTTAASVTGSSADLIVGDVLTIGGTGSYTAGKNVGIDKAIAVTAGRLTGVDAANYTLLNTTGSATGTITARALTASYSGGTRVYDGSTDAPVTGTLGGLISGDEVTLSQTAQFTGTGAKNVGTGKAVAITGLTLTGTDAVNYSLTGGSFTTTASITPRPLGLLGLTGVTAVDRVYDGTRTVTVNVATTGTVTPNPADLIAGDDVTVTAPPAGVTTGTLLDKNAGLLKPVAVAGLTLGGADAGNYSVASTSGVTVNIAPRNLTATYTGVSRTYDGTTAASVIGSSSDVIVGDSVIIGASGVFTGTGARNVGTGKSIDVSGGRLSSTDALNYVLQNPTGTATADISPRNVSATYAGTTRVYDGTANAPVSRNVSGLVAGDSVSLSETAVFTGPGAKNVGTGKAIAVSGITLTGDDAANYALLTTTATTTGGITPRPLNITGLSGISAVDRVYDGTAAVEIRVSGAVGTASGDIIAGDDLTVNLPSSGLGGGLMLNKNAGTAKAVVLTGLSLSGADAPNYVIAGTAGVTVNITPRALTPIYTGVSRVYDGTTVATIAGSSSDLIAGDAATIGATGEFTGDGAKNVGTGKVVRVVAGTLAGADAANYTLLDGNTSTTADITPRSLTPFYRPGTKVYDGTSNAVVRRGVTGGVISGDDLILSDTAVFTGVNAKNVGTDKDVLVTGISLSGADAINYSLTATTTTTTASITPRLLNISGIAGITATDRVYDGTLDVTVTTPTSLGSLSGDVVPGDTVTIGIGAGGLGGATLLDKNAGSNKPVALTGLTLSGPDAANYRIGGTVGVTVNIAPRPVVLLGVTATDRVYDGTSAVSISTTGGSISGALSGDDVSLPSTGVSGRVADKNVGTNRAVTVSGLSLSGVDAGNYVVTAGSGLTVNITPRTLNATASVADRVYNGTTGASVALASDALAGDVLTLSATAATYASANAGSSIAVDVTGLSLAGADAGNYTLASTRIASSGTISRALLSVAARNLSKTYGDTLSFGAADLLVSGLVTGETLGTVALSSDGAAAGAGVTRLPYAITLGTPTGGSYNPLNYDATLTNGQLTVLPRPLTIAANSLVRFAGDANPPGSFGLSTNPGGLVNGDALVPGQTVPAPAGSDAAPGVSLYSLLPSGARFASGSADNYAITYSAGQLLVLPRPPAAGEGGGTGGVDLAVQISEDELARARAELTRAAQFTQTATEAPSGATSPPVTRSAGLLTPAELSLLLSGDGQRLTLPALQKLPLITFDPQLRRGLPEAAGGQ